MCGTDCQHHAEYQAVLSDSTIRYRALATCGTEGPDRTAGGQRSAVTFDGGQRECGRRCL
eukprot:3940376-Rhodomonas_salina.4